VNRAVDATLTERRVALWHDAVVLMGDHPLSGVGPGRFELTSPTALADADTRQAHNEFLQQGAETGVLGFLLLTALFLWGFVRLMVKRRPDITTALAAASLAALGIHASVDYILHFPAIPAVAAALVGSATAKSMSRSTQKESS
jgi:O-antigen ligase